MTVQIEADLMQYSHIIQNTASKLLVDVSDRAWADAAYTMSYLAQLATLTARTASALATEEVRSLVVPEEILDELREKMEPEEFDSDGHYL